MATRIVRNQNELDIVMSQIMSEALENTANRLLKELLNIIDEDIYDTYYSEWYEPTGDIRKEENWVVELPKSYGNQYVRKVKTEISFKDSALSHNSYWAHRKIDAETFLGILNGDVPFGSLFDPLDFPWGGEFWNDFQEYCNNNFNRILLEECRKLKLNIG